MNKLSNYFYIFSKLTTSFILFFLLIILGYALYISYQDIDKNSENIDAQFLSLSENINLNSIQFKEIEKSIKQNEILLSKIKNSLTNSDDKKIFLKIQKDNELLLNQINTIEEKIKQISLLQQTNDQKNIKKSFSVENHGELNSLRELIMLKYKNGEIITSEMNLLSKLANSKSNNFLEKLILLETKKFYGQKDLYKEFSLSLNAFVKDKFLENNNNTIINFLLNYVSIKPNDLDVYEDDDLNILLKAKQHLDFEEYNQSLKQVLILNQSSKYFSGWIEQINLFLEFESTLMKVE